MSKNKECLRYTLNNMQETPFTGLGGIYITSGGQLPKTFNAVPDDHFVGE